MEVNRPLLVLFSLATLALSACGTSQMNAKVTRFHAEQNLSPGRTFTILPDERQRGSLEFQQYAEQVQARLEEQGFKALPASAGQADYVVTMEYGIGDRRTQVWQQPRSSVGFGTGFGFGGPRYGLGLGVPLGGERYDTESWTTYPHQLAVNMYNGDTWRRGDRAAVFEGKAVAELTQQQLPQAVPYLSRALFENFPGKSGETVAVTVPLKQ
jgi:hypothetical protein